MFALTPNITPNMPHHYVCQKLDVPFSINGRLDHPAWMNAPWTEDFVDILGPEAKKPRFRTRAKMLWDSQYLYVGAELEEPHVWGTLTEHDSVIFQDNDFEIFLDPDGDNHLYAEFEMNALNTTWDLLLVKPYRDGGPPVDGFELAGLRSAVHVRGTLNDPRDTDEGWTLEVAIPFAALKQIAGTTCPPKPGDVWRINFSRVQWITDIIEGRYVKRPGLPEDNWVWSPQGVVDMHQPEHWGLLQFSDGTPLPTPTLEPERARLMAVYHAQHRFRSKSGRWASELSQLGLETAGIRLEATGYQWSAQLGDWMIDHESRLRRFR